MCVRQRNRPWSSRASSWALSRASCRWRKASCCSFATLATHTLTLSVSMLAGATFWKPPQVALDAAAAAADDIVSCRYNADEGVPELRAALQEKIERENGLHGVRSRVISAGRVLWSVLIRWCALQYSIIVTAGANQALSSCMLTLVDPEDAVVLFKPYCARLPHVCVCVCVLAYLPAVHSPVCSIQ